MFSEVVKIEAVTDSKLVFGLVVRAQKSLEPLSWKGNKGVIGIFISYSETDL